MEAETKYKVKAFLWDQIVRPVYSFFNLSQLSSLIVAVLIINFITVKSVIVFLILAALLILFFIIDIIRYYQSGKYMDNFRKYKYPEYKAAIKKVRQERKSKLVEEANESIMDQFQKEKERKYEETKEINNN